MTHPYTELITEIAGLIEDGTIPVGALGLSENSAEFVEKEVERLRE